MPRAIHPMLATMVDKPFDDDAWLYEIKWDGYRAVVFLDGKAVRLVSRNQNDLTDAYPELHEIAGHIKAGKRDSRRRNCRSRRRRPPVLQPDAATHWSRRRWPPHSPHPR
jgi:hypothetical protein